MQPKITNGAAMIGAVGLDAPVQDALTDIASWCHVAGLTASFHPHSWAVLLLAGVGAWLHNNTRIPTP
jgi:hypothetical protein